jgi:AcrR family transcriptional regulator
MSAQPTPRDAVRTNLELREEATARMVKATIELVAEKGASRLTLAEVGRKAGYSHTLPNYYFKNKANLLSLVYANIISRFRDYMTQWTRTQPTARRRVGFASFLTLVQGYLEGARTDSPRARATQVLWAESFSSTPELLDEVRRNNQETIASIATHIRMGIEHGEIRPDVDAEALALVVIGALRGIVSQRLIDPASTDMDRVARTLTDLLTYGLQSSAGQDAAGVGADAAASSHT